MTKATFESIGAILQTKPVPSVPKPVDMEPAAAVAAVEPKTKASPNRTSEQSDGGVRTLPFRAPADLVHRLRQRAIRDGRSQPNVVLDAIEANADRLSDLVQRPAQAARDSMFTRLTSVESQDTVPVTVRITAQALDTIDNLVDQTGASSRTALVVAALEAHLGPQEG